MPHFPPLALFALLAVYMAGNPKTCSFLLSNRTSLHLLALTKPASSAVGLPPALLYASLPPSNPNRQSAMRMHWICTGTRMGWPRPHQPSLFGAGPREDGSPSSLIMCSRLLRILPIRARLKSPQHELKQQLPQLLCRLMERAWLYLFVSVLTLLECFWSFGGQFGRQT